MFRRRDNMTTELITDIELTKPSQKFPKSRSNYRLGYTTISLDYKLLISLLNFRKYYQKLHLCIINVSVVRGNLVDVAQLCNWKSGQLVDTGSKVQHGKVQRSIN
ncbi:hypothetical protein Smp_131480 [Schistosoma mansoni]|uniref:DUF4806 domain-containing protein n=1 Tax=Schistosoma mansoni TaxID=6183 RepID=G4VTJ9_SCHMA|nr:hypothetical protein Smp_131480 [Schistosoma mansoni]|eukprot:XP_018655641.1 hypothetical protein Smp_131480 [Schistosoma mansoni]